MATMAWLFVWILFVAITTISAYRHPYYSYLQQYQGQNHEALQHRVADRSLEHTADTLADYQRRPKEIESINQKHRADLSLWRSKRPIESSVHFEYYGERFKDRVKVSSALKDVELRNRYSSYNSANNFLKTFPSATNRKGTLDFDSVLYSHNPKSERNMFTPQILEECEELGICENSPDYPHEYVATLLAKLPETHIIFNLDKETPEITHTEDLNSNQTLMPCTPNTRIMYPDKVRSKTGKWVFIVNGKQDKVQGFSGTMCLAEGQQCNYTVHFRDGFSPTCVQIRTDRSMWALGDDGEMILVTTSIPSCCVCELRENKSY